MKQPVRRLSPTRAAKRGPLARTRSGSGAAAVPRSVSSRDGRFATVPPGPSSSRFPLRSSRARARAARAAMAHGAASRALSGRDGACFDESRSRGRARIELGVPRSRGPAPAARSSLARAGASLRHRGLARLSGDALGGVDPRQAASGSADHRTPALAPRRSARSHAGEGASASAGPDGAGAAHPLRQRAAASRVALAARGARDRTRFGRIQGGTLRAPGHAGGRGGSSASALVPPCEASPSSVHGTTSSFSG